MISIKILEKEHEQCVRKIERLQDELEEMEQNVRITKSDMEENMIRLKDLKTAISKLTEE